MNILATNIKGVGEHRESLRDWKQQEATSFSRSNEGGSSYRTWRETEKEGTQPMVTLQGDRRLSLICLHPSECFLMLLVSKTQESRGAQEPLAVVQAANCTAQYR